MVNHTEPPQHLSEDEIDELAVVLHEFITDPTFYGKQRIVEGNAILLSQEADAALAMLAYEYEENSPLQQSLIIHRRVLQRSREIGIREAFTELRQTLDETPLAESVEAAATQNLVSVIGEFVTTENWEESRAYLVMHPELLTAQADSFFERLIQTHTARGERNVVRQLVIHRDLLRACRELGIDPAFERVANPPETLDVIAENTIAVLTNRPDQRRAWEEIVRLSRIRAAELGDEPMLELLRAISLLLDGAAPREAAPALSGEHAACWARILDAVGPAGLERFQQVH